MFDFDTGDKPTSKCYVTHGTLPGYIDANQPPIKKQPFSTILSQRFTHTVPDFTV